MRLHSFLFVAIFIYSLIGCKPEQVPPSPIDPIVIKDTTIVNLSYGANTSQKLDLGLPANRTANTSLVIVVHGGGWSTGDKAELSWLLNGLKQKGFAVANINYRLTLNTPDNYKMQLDDIDSAIQFTVRRASIYTFSNQKLYIVGHSAGGHLALSYAYTRNANGRIKAAGSLAGPTDLFNMSYYNFNIYNSILEPFLGVPLFPATTASELRYKNCSPQYQATNNSPATIFFHGELDPVVYSDQSTQLAAKLGTLGVDKKLILYPLTFHDWWTDGIKISNTIDELKNWFNGHI